MGAAVGAWGIGDTIWTFAIANDPNPPFPSIADIGFLAVYPPAYAAIVLLLRSRGNVARQPLARRRDRRPGRGRARHRRRLPGRARRNRRLAGGRRDEPRLSARRRDADRARRLGARRHRLAPGSHLGFHRGRPARLLGQRLPLPVRHGHRELRGRGHDRPRLAGRRTAARLGGVAARTASAHGPRSRAGRCSSLRCSSA